MERGTGECPSARERLGCCSFDPGQGGVTFGGVCVGDCSANMYEDLVRNRYGAIDVDQVPLDLNKGDLGDKIFSRIFKNI